MQPSLAGEPGVSLLPTLLCRRQGSSSVPPGSSSRAPTRLHSPPEDGLTGQQDPAPASPSRRRSRSSRQADAGSGPGTTLYAASSAASRERGSLPHPPTHSRPERLSAPGQPGAHAGPPPLPSHLPPMQQKSPSSPSPADPTPAGGPAHRQGWHHAGCTAARELAGSRGKSQARAAMETWQEGWTGAAEGGEGASTHPWPLHLGEGALSYSPSQSACFSQGQASTSFPLASNGTQPSPVSCPSHVPSSSPQPENSRSFRSPLRQRAAGTPPEESSVHGVGAEEGHWRSPVHPRGKGGGITRYRPSQPSRAKGQWLV